MGHTDKRYYYFWCHIGEEEVKKCLVKMSAIQFVHKNALFCIAATVLCSTMHHSRKVKSFVKQERGLSYKDATMLAGYYFLRQIRLFRSS